MQKKINKVLFIFILTFGFCILVNMNGKAAEKGISLKQTDASNNSVKIEWSCLTEFKSNIIEFSANNVNWSVKETNTYSTSAYETIYGLMSGSRYYVRVKLFSDYHCKTLIDTSDSIVICTTPKEPENVKQVSATNSSIGLSWNVSPGATSYTVFRYFNYNNYQEVAKVTSNKVTISKLNAGTVYDLFVIANTTISNFTASSYEYIPKRLSCKTVPPKIIEFGIDHYFYYSNRITFFINYSGKRDGYQFEIYNSSGKRVSNIYSNSTYSQSIDSSLVKGNFYKYRVRPYIIVNNQKVYGAWSVYKYYGVPKNITAKRARSKKIRLSWNKVKGAVNYTVSGSLDAKTGFKTIKKLSSKKNSLVVSKIKGKKLKKGKTYYLRVVVTGKNGKKKINSPVWISGSVTI